MLYYRCKCGKSEAWGSMPPFPCTGCSECGTTLDTSPSLHHEPKPHELRETRVQTDVGEMPLSVCVWCGKSKAELNLPPASHFFLDGVRHDQDGPIHGAHVRAKLQPERAGYALYVETEGGFPDKYLPDADIVPSGSKLYAVPGAHV